MMFGWVDGLKVCEWLRCVLNVLCCGSTVWNLPASGKADAKVVEQIILEGDEDSCD
jgi:hypothetical protein